MRAFLSLLTGEDMSTRLTINGLAHDLRGIAHADGKAWFVEGALPGETVQARLLVDHAQRVDAVAGEIITAAVDRVVPACPHYGECGGCDVQHISHAGQVALKQQVLLDQLLRFGKVQPATVLPPLVSEPWRYRRRARLACKWSSADKHLAIGLRERHGQQIVEIGDCPVLVPALQALLKPLRESLSQWSQPRQLGHVELLAADNGCAVLLRVLAEPSGSDAERLRQFASAQGVSVFLQRDERQSAQWFCGSAATLQVSAGDDILACVPGDFVQGNAGVNTQLIAAVLDAVQPAADDVLLEAFCGLGNFTLPLSHRVQKIAALDVSEAMLLRARQSAKTHNVQWQACDLGAFEPKNFPLPLANKILLDPPRDGAQAFCRRVKLDGVVRLVYVSCNPSTLARDAGILAERGFSLQVVQLVDMFPQTGHIEALAVFAPGKPVRKTAAKPAQKRLKRWPPGLLAADFLMDRAA